MFWSLSALSFSPVVIKLKGVVVAQCVLILGIVSKTCYKQLKQLMLLLLFCSVPLIPYGAEAETFLLTSAVPGRVLPTNTRPLENFGKLFFCKFYL